jgi:hypothetical protein
MYLAHNPGRLGVGGSNPLAPTNGSPGTCGAFRIFGLQRQTCVPC